MSLGKLILTGETTSTIIANVVGLAVTIFGSIAARNKNIVDGLVAEKAQIKQAQQETIQQLHELRLIRDGLREEYVELLGIRARRITSGQNGLGLFFSKRIKKENIRLDSNKTILETYADQAEEVALEIQELGGSVTALRQELGIREDAPLTKLEASLNTGMDVNKLVMYVLVGTAVITISALLLKYRKPRE